MRSVRSTAINNSTKNTPSTHCVRHFFLSSLKPRIAFIILFSISLFFFLSYSQQGSGLAWDEAFYYHPSQKAVEWLQHLFQGNMSEVVDVDTYFGDIWELPPLGKIVIGLSYAVGRTLGFNHLFAMRWLNYFTFLIQLIVIAWYLKRYLAPYNDTWWFAPLIFAGFPRILGHAHFATVDLLSSLFILFSTMLFLEYILKKSMKMYWLFCAVSVLGVLVKFNNLVHFCLLLAVLIIWERKKCWKKLLATIILFPLGIYLLWPWLWSAPVSRFLRFWNYFFHHAQTSVLYMGTHYAFTRAPWHYPFVMFLVTTPLLHLILLLSGIAPLFHFYKKKLFFNRSLLPFYLTGFCALYPLLLFLAPNAPTYDGIRLFIPAFPFITLILCMILSWWKRSSERYRLRLSRFLLPGAMLFFLIHFVIMAGSWHPYFLSYYNQLTGGLEGAHHRFEVTYWCEPFNHEVIDYLNEEIDGEEEVRFLAFQRLIPEIYQEWNYLDAIDFTSEPPYDYHVLYNRKGFFGRIERHLFENELPHRVFTFRGVPFIIIYHTKGRY